MKTRTPFSFFTIKRGIIRKHAGVSPVIATTIILAITITMGLALYSYVNSASNTATQSFAQEVTDYVNYRNDRFVITNISYKTNLCGKFLNGTQITNCVSAYLFNSGDVPITINQVLLGANIISMQQYCIDIPNKNNFEVSQTNSTITIPPKKMQSVSFHTLEVSIAGKPICLGEFKPPNQNQVFYTNVMTQNGSYQTAFQKYEVQ